LELTGYGEPLRLVREGEKSQGTKATVP